MGCADQVDRWSPRCEGCRKPSPQTKAPPSRPYKNTIQPIDAAIQSSLRETTALVLASLTARERTRHIDRCDERGAGFAALPPYAVTNFRP